MKSKTLIMIMVFVLLCGCKTIEDNSQSEISQPASVIMEQSAEISQIPSPAPERPFSEALEEESEQPEPVAEVASLAEPVSERALSQTNTVTLTVLNGEQTLLSVPDIALVEGDTAFSVLLRVTKDSQVHFDFSGKGSTAYVKAIGNIYEFDEGPESGWMFSVNGIFPQTGCGAYTVSAGDVIIWHYTKNMGIDIGAKIA